MIGDETLLDQIFTNLIVNALTYRRREVSLKVAVSGHVEGGYAIIRVTDNGIGIRPEYWNKIFNIFQRLHSQDAYPGTGIGLSIVKKSVELLEGEVSGRVGSGRRKRIYCEASGRYIERELKQIRPP